MVKRIACLVIACCAIVPPARSADSEPRPGVRTGPANGHEVAIVTLSEQADLSGASAIRDKSARGGWVLAALRSAADRTQPPLSRWLEARGGRVERFVVANALSVEAAPAVLDEVARLPGVASVEPAVALPFVDPMERSAGPGPLVGSAAPLAPSAIEIGLRQIGADKVWDMGYRGAGAVVAVLDTGVSWQHPALELQYRGRESGSDHNWLDPINGKAEPVDSEGHGTHVAGIAVGGTEGRQIGVAPGAQWIACRVGLGEMLDPTAAMRCLEWALAPTTLAREDARPDLAPDVVNASWSIGLSELCHSQWLRSAIRSLDAAGIVVVGSAGNRGAECGTVCAPSEYEEVLAVADYDGNTGRIHSSSSRGPVPGEAGERIKPDVSAPGIGINSSVPTNRYERRSGTSMSAPHVAGAVALLVSARPDLRGDPDAIRALLLDTAEYIEPDRCGPAGATIQNNSAGHGLLRVDLAAAEALVPTPTVPASATPTASPTIVQATATETPGRPSASATDTAMPVPTSLPSATAGAPQWSVMLPSLRR